MNPNASAFNPNAAAFVMPGMEPEPAETNGAEVKELEASTENLNLNSTPAAQSPAESPAQIRTTQPVKEEKEPDKKPAVAMSKKRDITPHDSREHLNIVFIGHVDAGKSTISGNILKLTGQVDERTLQKYEIEAKKNNRESWYLAFIMDTNEEERAKGKTVEVGRAPFTTDSKRYTILDAPGHAKFVPNMLSGAAQADVGVLVISARKGEFEAGFERNGQTREHVQLAKTVGIERLVVAINKMDEGTVLWSKERYDAIIADLTKFLKQWGFIEGKNLWFLPISGLTGSNLKERQTECTWYDGPSLIELLDQMEPVGRDGEGPVRIPVVDRFKEMGSVCVIGKVENGTVVVGDQLVLVPGNNTVTVSSLSIEEEEVKCARPGENVQLILKDCQEEDLHRGQVICSLNAKCHVAQTFEAVMKVTELLEHKSLMSAGYLAVLHMHSIVQECTIDRLVQDMTPKKKGKPVSKKAPAFVKSGSSVRCIITVDQPIAIEKYQEIPQLGRFTLRDEGITIAIGKVTKIKPIQ